MFFGQAAHAQESASEEFAKIDEIGSQIEDCIHSLPFGVDHLLDGAHFCLQFSHTLLQASYFTVVGLRFALESTCVKVVDSTRTARSGFVIGFGLVAL